MGAFCCFKADFINRKQTSAIAHLSYIAATSFRDDVENKTYNYNNKKHSHERVVDVKTYLPDYASDKYRDITGVELLWNDIEKQNNNEKMKLALNIIIVFPYEMKEEDREKAIQDFCKNYTDQGFPCTVAYHVNPDGTNPHCHILVGNAIFDERTGEFKKTKNQRIYDLDENGKKIPLYEYETDDKGKPILDENGNKIFKLDENGEKIQKIRQGRKQYQRKWIVKNPLDKYGVIKDGRVQWCESANKFLPLDYQMSPLSFAEQGLDKKPHIAYTREEYQQEKRIQEQEEKEIATYGKIIHPQEHVDVYYQNLLVDAENKAIEMKMEVTPAVDEKLQTEIADSQRKINLITALEDFITPLVNRVKGWITHRHTDDKTNLNLKKKAVQEVAAQYGNSHLDMSNLHDVDIARVPVMDSHILFNGDLISQDINIYDISIHHKNEHDDLVLKQHYETTEEMLTTGIFADTQTGREIQKDYENYLANPDRDTHTVTVKQQQSKGQKREQGKEVTTRLQNKQQTIDVPKKKKKKDKDEPSL